MKRKTRKIGIDLDGTVADYITKVVPLLKEHYGLEPVSYDNARTIEEIFGLTRETRPEGMRQFLYEELHLFRNLSPIEGMSDVVFCLQAMGAEIYFITARSGTPIIVEDTREWLAEHKFVYNDVFHVKQKSTFCKQMGIDVMLEDEVFHILEILEAGIDVVVPDQPWNRSLSTDDLKHPGYGRFKRAFDSDSVFFAVKEFLQ